MFYWMKIITISIAAIAGAPIGAHAANDLLTGKEYKVLLVPSKFDTQPITAANQFLTDLKAKLQATSFDRTISSKFSEDETRHVRFYDSPGTCRLKNLSYMFRTRSDGDDSEVTLKFRSSSQSVAASTSVSGSVSGAETKLEVDITPPFKQVFSHSTTEYLADSKDLNILDDVEDLFPATKSLDLPEKEPLSIVGNLDLTERTYDGPSSDLGEQDADFSLTLWYPNGALKPAIAELSFKVKAPESDFTAKVDERSKLIFEAIQGMSQWISGGSLTKTEWVYQYQPSFCTNVQLL
jgi:hypothetical protein